jgi:hypothetical protein
MDNDIENIVPENDMEFDASVVAEHFQTLADSASMIDGVIGNSSRTAGDIDGMACCVRHIGVMLNMKHIKDSGTDLKPFADAAARGAAWLAQN